MLSTINNVFLFKNEYYLGYLDFIIYAFLALIPLLIAIAFFTLAERKALAAVQRRKGPNVAGVWGFLQPFADGLKLIVKEILIPNKANKMLFLFSSGLTLFLSFLGWLAIPFNPFNPIFLLNTSLLYILTISSLSVYSILLAGWASNSKYALLGSLRSVSQMISYEVSIGLIVIPIILFSGSLSLAEIVYKQLITIWFVFPLFPLTIIYFISILAETNRIPFDLPEAEAELVAGYNVEFSGFTFAAFFLGEYSNILIMTTMFVLFFLAGGDWWGLETLTTPVNSNIAEPVDPVERVFWELLAICLVNWDSLPWVPQPHYLVGNSFFLCLLFIGFASWWFIFQSFGALLQSNFSILILLYDFFLGFKITFLCFLFVFIRGNLPRFRFDQLMFIGWKVLLPLALSATIFYPCVLFALEGLNITQLPRIGSNFNFISTFSVRF